MEVKREKGNLKQHETPNLQIPCVNEGEDYQINGIDCIFKNIIEENFHKIRKDTRSMQIQETNRTPKRRPEEKETFSAVYHD